MKSREFEVPKKTTYESSITIDKQGPKVENTVVKRLNPIGSNSCPFRCHSCGSVRHMVQDCSESYDNIEIVHESTVEDIEDIEDCWLFTSNKTELMQDLIGESLNSAVKDSACSFTVAGEEWLNPKSTGLFALGTALGGGVFTSLCKIRCRHPRKLKLSGLIAYIMFYKIC